MLIATDGNVVSRHVRTDRGGSCAALPFAAGPKVAQWRRGSNRENGTGHAPDHQSACYRSDDEVGGRIPLTIISQVSMVEVSEIAVNTVIVYVHAGVYARLREGAC